MCGVLDEGSYKFSSVHPSIHMPVTPFSPGATYYFFLIVCISKYLIALILRNCLCPKWLNLAFLGQNSAYLNFSLNMSIRFFKNLPDVGTCLYLKEGKSDHFEFSEKFFSKVTLLNFSLNLFIGFLWNCTRLSLKDN